VLLISWPQTEESLSRYPVHPLRDYVHVHGYDHDRLLHHTKGMGTDPRTYSRPRYLDSTQEERIKKEKDY
jgi:hypothetical protein